MFRTSRGTRVRGESGSGDSGTAPRPPAASPPSAAAPYQEPPPASQPPPPNWGAGTQPAGTSPETAQVGGQPDDGQHPAATAHRTDVRHTRASSVYIGAGVVLILLIIVLDFILQNLHQTNIHLFAADFSLPVGIMVLLGAIGGGLIVMVISLFHVVQLRRANRRRMRSG